MASPPKPELMKEYAGVLTRLKKSGHQLIVVVGGGSVARDFIRLANEVGLKPEEQDEIAISISRVLAQLLAMKGGVLKGTQVPTSLDELVRVFDEEGIAFMGGLKPGMTTDTVAAMAASMIKANLIVKATDQDGLFTKDPRKYSDAQKIDELGFGDLSEMLAENSHKVGIHQILDPEAVRLLQKERIVTVIVNGFKPENIILAVEGRKVGTRIH